MLIPINFSLVISGVYRSGLPIPQNLPFLQKLELRSILFLGHEAYSPTILKFIKENDILFHQIDIGANKEPFLCLDDEKVSQCLQIILDSRNHPILVHCINGRHRTGCLIGCLRKLCQWPFSTIFLEYRRLFPITFNRDTLDTQYIECFDTSLVKYDIRYIPKWLPLISQSR